MRWAEFSLFLVPFVLYAAWSLSARLARPWLVWAALALVVLLAGGTIFYGLSRRVDPAATYVPAHIEAGRVVPGQGVAK